jgi:hypothetical protein
VIGEVDGLEWSIAFALSEPPRRAVGVIAFENNRDWRMIMIMHIDHGYH